MSFRVLLIESEVDVRLKLDNLVVDKGEGEIWIPLTDISMIVIDNLKISITARMMSAFAEFGIGLLFCNQLHQPIGIYNAYATHSRGVKVLSYQINKTSKEYDVLWADTIRHKINNQAAALARLNLSEDRMAIIIKLANEVIDGDLTNREAHAAKVYFNTMMGESYSRGNEDILLNSGLDYGYAIIRAYLARLCVGYGLNCQLGMHHKSEYNQFNLVDDLIEPIRPFVDIVAFSILDGEEYFRKEHRHALINLLNHKVIYMEKKMHLCNALEEYVKQYLGWIQGKRDYIVYPDVYCYIGEVYDEV